MSSQSRTAHGPSFPLLSSHRKVSWSSKHSANTNCVWKICKGFSTQDAAGQDLPRKQLYRGAFWGIRDLRRCLPRHVPIQEWRFSSSWGKDHGTASGTSSKAGAVEEEDWYNRWEKQKLKQYEDFMKKVEQDPYTALFGQSYINLRRGKLEPKAATNAAPHDFAEKNSASKKKGDRDTSPSKSEPSSDKIPEEQLGVSRIHSKSEILLTEEYNQGYEIDPITNRKVFKKSTITVAAFEQDRPQVEDAVGAAEDVQVSSSSNSPSNDTPPSDALKQNTLYGRLDEASFKEIQKPTSDAQSTLRSPDAKPKLTTAQIKSAWDRHLSRKGDNRLRSLDLTRSTYEFEDDKTEDIDLLRPSDVRASSGLRGHPPKESAIDKQARRKKLEENFENSASDHAVQFNREAASNKLVQEREENLIHKDTGSELRLGVSAKDIRQDPSSKDKEACESTSTARANGLSDTEASNPIPISQASNSTPPLKNESVSELWSGMALKSQDDIKDKASKLKSQIVPFKAKLDAMKAEYDFLRLQWIHETRREKEKAAKEEEKKRKAQRIMKMANQMHEEEIKTQKVAMEAIETRTSDRTVDMVKTAPTKVEGNNDVEKPARRRLQSFLQGEGDMASNVHEFAGRDRWYKRKAPHAMDAKDAEMDAKLQKLASDRALIREIRDIYEDTYGTIDTRHRQGDVITTSRTENPDHHITSFGKIAPHAQLPPIADISVSSYRVNKYRSSDSLVQKLFSQLRDVHGMIRDDHSQTKQTLDPNGQDQLDVSKARAAFEKTITQIVETSLQLAATVPGGVIARPPTSAITALNSGSLVINRRLWKTAAEPTDLGSQEGAKLKTYCILAYDSDTESVKSAESSSLTDFSKEESLLPSDALARLKNPGKFLPYAMSLAETGYKPVYATSKVLVFRKGVDPKDSEGLNKAGAKKELGSIRNSFDPIIAQAGSRSFDSTIEEDVHGQEQARLRGNQTEQQEVEEVKKAAVEKNGKEDQKGEKISQTAMNGNTDEEQPLKDGERQQFASSSSSSSSSPSLSHPSGDLVHRLERVFSGRRHAPLIQISVKPKKSKRPADKRRRPIKSMLLAGAFTAACCYCVGVASEMMHD